MPKPFDEQPEPLQALLIQQFRNAADYFTSAVRAAKMLNDFLGPNEDDMNDIESFACGHDPTHYYSDEEIAALIREGWGNADGLVE